jgi:hypothetical protein
MIPASACNTIIFVIAVVFVIILALIISIIAWLEKLQRDKGCECAEDWKRTYILRFLSFLFVWNVAVGSFMIYNFYSRKCQRAPGSDSPMVIKILRVLLGIGFIAYLVLSFLYVRLLNHRQCKCAMSDNGYKIMKIHLILSSVILLLPIILPSIAVLIGIFFALKYIIMQKLKK